MAVLTSGFPATAGSLLTLTPITTQLNTLAGVQTQLSGIALLSNDFAQDVTLRTSGKTIGAAGQLFFGVGPAMRNGAPDGINLNDYFPTHAASGSFM